MFMFSIQLTKRKIIVAAALIVLLGVAITASVLLTRDKASGGAGDEEEEELAAAADEQRCSFLEQFGWEVETTPISQNTVRIPGEFDAIYTPYNEMQLAQGFDLAPYKGKTVNRYCYAVLNYPLEKQVVANLLVYEGKIIGGDLDSPALGGFMHGFAKEAQTSAISVQPWEY